MASRRGQFSKVMNRQMERMQKRMVKTVAKGGAKKGLHLVNLGLGSVELSDGTVTRKLGLSVWLNPAMPKKVFLEGLPADTAGHWWKPNLQVSVWKRNGNNVRLWQWQVDLPSKRVKEINAVWKVGTSEETHGWANTKVWEKMQK